MTKKIILKIGKWQLDTATHQLTEGENTQLLTPQLSELLTFLAFHPGEVFSRDQLVEKACQGIVSDAAINQAIARLRKHLGDDPREAAYIETVAKRGYRLIAEVEDISQQRQTAAIQQKTKALWLAASAITFLVIISIVYFTVSAPRSTSQADQSRLNFSPLTSLAGLEVSPSIHPQGQFMAYSWKSESASQYDLFSRNLTSNTLTQITDTPAAVELHPVWSPDGRSLAFVSHSAAGCKIQLITFDGVTKASEEVKTIADCSPFDIQLNWHPDGQRLIYNRRSFKGGPLRVFATNIYSGQTQELSHADKGITGDVAFSISPSGQQLAVIRTHHWNQSELWLIDILSNESQQVAVFPYWIRSLTWDQLENGVVFSPAPFYRQLVHFNLASKVSKVLAKRDAVIEDVYRHPINGEYLVSERRYNYDIVSTPNPKTNLGVAAENKIIVASTRQDWHPMLNPVANSIAFISDRSGHIEIWQKDLDSLVETKLTQFNGDNQPSRMHWSPDGNSIVFDTTKNLLFVVDTENLSMKKLETVLDPARNPRWTSQGIYFSSIKNDEWQIEHLTTPTSQPKVISQPGIFSGEPFVSDNEKFLYTKFYQSGFWTKPSETNDEQQLMTKASQGPFNQWQQTDNGLYHLGSGSSGRLTVFYYDFESGLSNEVMQFHSRDLSGFSISADESTIFHTQVKQENADIMLVSK